MGNLLGDLRYALRSLARQPTFAAVAILTLVLGIGLNTAIFSVIKAVLLNQLPYQDSSRLVVLWEQSPTGTTDLVAPLTFGDWQQQSQTLQSMAAFRQLRYAFAGDGQPLDVPSVRATPGLFATLRVNAMLGRTFLPEEGTPGADRVAILSQSFWERHFGGSPSAIGRKIQLDAQPYTVVGVMPARVRFSAERERRRLDPAQLRSERRPRPIAQGALAERRRTPGRRVAAGAGAEGDDADCRPPRHGLSGQQRRVGRARDRGTGTTDHHRAAGAPDDLGRRRFPAADRLRQRREPDPGAALQPARRDRRPPPRSAPGDCSWCVR